MMTPEELDQLEELLTDDLFQGEAMTLDILQGFLCAVVSAPYPVLPSDWLDHALGENPAYQNQAQAQQILDLLMKFYNEIAVSLAEGEDFDLFLYGHEDNQDEIDYEPWCEGYIFGSQIGRVNWFEAAGEFAPDLSEKLEVFMLLSGMLKEDAIQHKEPWLSPSEEKQALGKAAKAFPSAISDIYRFWQAQATGNTTYVHTTPKTGRNDPCPCGSGKKFKQCCGKETLH
ncbi:MAG: UPF0149 family protein [Sulfuricellaceae bacterium]|nr:UPF0149 family protein [Sulfuricellaceae bacterium]